MFERGYSLLNATLWPDALPLPRARTVAEDTIARAMVRETGDMPLSERLADPRRYRVLRRARRDALEALLQAEPNEAVLRRATDMICLILEESRWSELDDGQPFDLDAHPVIDVHAAETAILLGWTMRAFGDRLHPRVRGRMLTELRRRVFTPFAAHTDYPFMVGRGERPVTVLSDILLCALLTEHDESRRANILRKALRQLDHAISKTRLDEPLEDICAETAAIADVAVLLGRATRGRFDVTREVPTEDRLDALLIPYLSGPYFADPAGGTIMPALPGEALYRIGLCAHDADLCALGASLDRARHIPSVGVTGRLLDLSNRPMIEAETGRVRLLKRASTPGERLMLSRFDGLTFAMHTGSGRADAGGFTLFSGDRPVFIETAAHANVPAGQLDVPTRAPEAEFEAKPERDAMTVELTAAWPGETVRAHQRTAIVMRDEHMLQLVDMFETTGTAPIAFRFITPIEPVPLPVGVRLGDVVFGFDSSLSREISVLPDRLPTPDGNGPSLYAVTLTADAPAPRAFYAFRISRV